MSRKNKIGGIFLASMLALASLGISYAGFSDIIYVSGTVDTATVNLEVEYYSGTWLWKVWGDGAPADEVYIFSGLTNIFTDAVMLQYLEDTYQGCQYEKVSWAFARAGGDGETDVVMEYHNIFPCTEYIADVYIHYTGSIPVKVDIINEDWDAVLNIPDLWNINFYVKKGVQDQQGSYTYTTTELPAQLHYCNRLKIELGIHMLQPVFVNNYQGKTYNFGFDINAIQWNDDCQTPPPSMPVYNQNKGTYYFTIQQAIDDANPDDTILVEPGTYPGNIIVYKQGLTIKSTGSPSSTIVDASQVDYSTYQNAWGKGINYAWAQTYDPGLLKNGFMIWSDDVTIDGFSIINANYPAQYNRGIGVLIGSIDTTYAGFIPWNIDQWGGLISPVDTPTPTSVIVRNNIIDGASDAIYNWASSGNIIEYNTISNTQPLGGTGIQAYGGGQNNIIRGNTITNAVDAICVAGAWPDVLLDVSGTQVYDNTLTNNVVGIKFYNIAGSGVVAQDNNIYTNSKGISIEGVGGDTVAVAHYNNIVGNTIGVDNAVGLGTFDAEDNWWGASDGPSSVGPGTGDSVSNNVDYDPWAASAFP